jgi:GTP-binding protein EngB required for normal cell division
VLKTVSDDQAAMTNSAAPADPLSGALDALRHCLSEGWPESYPPVQAVTRLSDRLRDAQFHLAVLGQFKRGKSTFINALLGMAVLPTAVVPLTAIATFIAWAPAPLVRVTYQGSRALEDYRPASTQGVQETLNEFVTERGNPANARGVARVELFLPAAILRNGVVLIDTPGIGSTLQHNTDTALQVLPECDAALFIVSADPPITSAEIAYLAAIRSHVVRLFFVLNKIDYLNPPERLQMKGFLQKSLCEGGITEPSPVIYQVSARQALAAAVDKDDGALEASGLRRIEREIVQFLSTEKTASLRASVSRKACDLADQALADLQLQIRALEMPLADLEQRAAAFQQALRDFELERRSAQDLLAGDRTRAKAELEDQADRLRREALQYILAAVQRAIAENGNGWQEGQVQRAVADAIPMFFAARLSSVATALREKITHVLATHQARCDALIASVRRTAAELFDVPFHVSDTAEPFHLGQEPYWLIQKQQTVLMPSPGSILTRLLPASQRQERRRKQLEGEIAELVQSNVENLRWATLQALEDTFRRIATRMDKQIGDALAVTQNVIAAALERRQSRAGEVEIELARLLTLRRRLEASRADLGSQVTEVS